MAACLKVVAACLNVVAACLKVVVLSGTYCPVILCLTLCGVTANVHELRLHLLLCTYIINHSE